MKAPSAAKASAATIRTTLVLAALAAAGAGTALAVSTQTWTREGDSFRAGSAEGMVVTPDGRLAPGPKAEVLARPDSAVLWSVALAGSEVLAGAGEDKGLLRVGGAAGAAVPKLGGQEVFALAPGGANVVYAATGPRGAVFRVDLARGEAKEIFRPDATYVWALLPLPDGALAVATGLPARVHRVDAKGAASVLWQTDEPHVRALAAGPNGRVLAGTAGSGRLVELDGKGKAFTLWDSDRPEVVAIASDAEGTVWAAFAGTAKAGEADSSKPSARSAGTVNVTVRASRGGGDGDGGDDDAPRSSSSPPADDKGAASSTPQTTLPGGGGALVRLASGEEPETSWSDDKETPLALVLRPGGGVLLGTAQPARIWWFDANGRLGLFDERKDSRAVSALAAAGERVVAATSNPATIVSYGPGAAAPARWTSDVYDAKVRTTFGRVQATAARGDAASFKIFVRAGNTAEPDSGWTDWVAVPGAVVPPDGDGGGVALPRARFFQVKVEATAGKPYGDGVSRIVLRHRPGNRAPRVESVEALPRGVALRALPPPQMSGGEVPVVAPPRGPDLERALGDANPGWRSKRAYEPTAITVAWEARDPDGDALRYDLAYCRDRGTRCADADWVKLAEDLDQSFFSFDSRTLPDGVYRFRLVANDRIGNALGEARTTERVSEPASIDNTAPQIERAEYTSGQGGELVLTVTARDPGGRLVRAEVLGEDGAFSMLPPADGVDDAAQETWKGRVAAPPAGRELLVRVVDAAGNSASLRAEPVRGASNVPQH